MRDTIRLVLLVVVASGLMATTLVGTAEAPSGVRIPAQPIPPASTDETMTVRRGDHFWKISEQRLEQTDPAAPVGPYWRRVVEANKDNIRSGDPDLIFPGEVIELPAP